MFKIELKLCLDGYTVSDVLMYWKNTPIRGVEEAELPQFTIIGYETNDRKVILIFVICYLHILLLND